MRLVVELNEEAETGPDVVGLHELAAALRTPRRLVERLRGEHYEAIEVRQPAVVPSALQAAVQLALLVARAERWNAGGPPRRRLAFAGWALGVFATSLAREAWFSALAAARLVRASRRSYRLPRLASATDRVLYLRVEPSLRWGGRQVGGAVTHTSGVVNGLLARGCEVRILAAEQPAGTADAAFTAVAPRRRLQLVRGLGYVDYGVTLLQTAAGREADFVYQRYQLGSFAGLELARRLGVPLVLEFNGPEVWVERHWRSGRRMVFERQLERLEREHLRQASLVVVVSDALGEYVSQQGVPAERLMVNPNGVDTDALAAYRERTPTEWRGAIGLPEAPTVGFIGTFGLWHGALLLPRLIELVPEARWVIVGGGGQFEELRAEIEDRGLADQVTMPGLVPHDRALELLAGADVCISPHVPSPDGTRFFGSPTKLFEYMGLAKAIVAADLEQIGEVIEHERSGLLFPAGDVEAAGEAIRRLLDDGELRERLGLAALERAATHYTWEAHARRILERIAPAPSAGKGGASLAA